MNKTRLIAMTILVAALFLAGCSKKESTETSSEESSSMPAAAATPIDQSTVGEVTGKIMFQGTKPKLAVIHMDQDPVCVSKHSEPVHVEDGEVNDDGTLPNVFVYVKEGAEKYTFATPTDAVTLDQNGCMYKPHVVGLMAGQTLHIVSSDATTHNIHPLPKDNREWNESQPPGAAPLDKVFARPEVMIPVKCNQHPWMRSYIGVVNNPFYFVTGADGTYTLKGLPPGDYTIEAWTAIGGPSGQTQDQKVTVSPKGTASLDFTFKS
ncbi:MAG TPA: carboxypeptidase regulatory-like domain-containing protein [Terriglobia bacterium]|nr:carboxypeptidase regulatory-like domain-containing protein [Terriglobia bacterium]